MRKPLIFITLTLITVAIFTTIFWRDITNIMHKHSNRPVSTSTTDEIKLGAKILIQIKPDLDNYGNPIPITDADLKSIQQNLAKRINQFQNLEYITNILQGNKIEIQLSDTDLPQAQEIWKKISNSMRLTIHAGHPLYNTNPRKAEELATKVAQGDEIVPTYETYPAMQKDQNGVYIKDQNGNFIIEKYFLTKRKAAINGINIEFAQASTYQPGLTEVELNDKAAQQMIDFTSNLKQGDLIICLLDNRVISAASLNAPTLGKHFVITGGADKAEAEQLAAALNAPIKNQLELIEIQNIAN